MPSRAFIDNKKNASQRVSEEYYNRTARDLVELEPGTVVRIKNKYWDQLAVVVEKVATRSYVVRTDQGVLYRRNRQDLLKVRGTVGNNFVSNGRREVDIDLQLETVDDCETLAARKNAVFIPVDGNVIAEDYDTVAANQSLLDNTIVNRDVCDSPSTVCLLYTSPSPRD